MPEIFDQEQMDAARAFLDRNAGRPDITGMLGPQRAAVQSAIQYNTEPTASGRIRNPTDEIARLLDLLEKNRNEISQISLEPTAADIDLQKRIQEATLTPALAQVSGGFGARGLSGSSLEAVQRSLMANQVALQSQQQLRQAGLDRADFEMGRNRQLFNSLIGSIQATTTPGAPGTQAKRKKKSGLGSVLGGIGGALAGSVLGPVGTALGSRLGGALLGGGGDYDESQYEQSYLSPGTGPLSQFSGGQGYQRIP